MESSFFIQLDKGEEIGATSLHSERLTILDSTNHGVYSTVSCALSKSGQAFILNADVPNKFREEGKVNKMNGMPFPEKLRKTDYLLSEFGPQLNGTIQSVKHSGNMVAAIDDTGFGFCQRYKGKPKDNSSCDPPLNKRPKVDEYSMIEPMWEGEKRPNWEKGWVSLCLTAEESSPKVATTSFFAKETLVSEVEGKKLNKISHFLNPTCSVFIKGGPFGAGDRTIAVTEWNTVSIWDLRCSEKNVTRFRAFENFSDNAIFSLDCDGSNSNIAFAGEGKDVSFADTRKWTVKHRWKCPVKYDVVGVQLSTDNRYCFASGLDNELILNDLNSSQVRKNPSQRNKAVPQSLPSGSLLHQNHRVFRSEAQWAGSSLWKGPKSVDESFLLFMGYSISGKMYILRYKRNA